MLQDFIKAESFEQRMQKIEDRNNRVEEDKAWETSWVRRILLAIFTYGAIGAYMREISVSNPWLRLRAKITYSSRFPISSIFHFSSITEISP